MERSRRAAERLRADGADVVLMFCTVHLPQLEEAGIFTPCPVLEQTALALRGGTAIGVLQPIEELMDHEMRHWHALPAPVVSAYAPPLVEGSPENAQVAEPIRSDPDRHLVEPARALVDQGAGVIVLDCMGFQDRHHDLVLAATGKPVVQPTALLTQVLRSTLGPTRRAEARTGR